MKCICGLFVRCANSASSRPQSQLRRIPTPYPKEMKHRLNHMRNLALKQLNLPLAADAKLGASEDGASAAVSRVRASPSLVVGVSAGRQRGRGQRHGKPCRGITRPGGGCERHARRQRGRGQRRGKPCRGVTQPGSLSAASLGTPGNSRKH